MISGHDHLSPFLWAPRGQKPTSSTTSSEVFKYRMALPPYSGTACLNSSQKFWTRTVYLTDLV